MSGEEMRFVREAFESNYIAPLGPQVNAFEKEFAENCFTKLGRVRADEEIVISQNGEISLQTTVSTLLIVYRSTFAGF